MSDKTPSSDGIRYVNLYESQDKIYTRKISGFFQNIRRYTGLPLIAGFLLLPWLAIDGRPAVLFDLPARQFHILWITFWPQDFMLLAWLLIISAFSLFTVTTLLGRVYCGFTCPQTVWTLMFISIEHFFQGDRNKQIRLAKQAWGFDKLWRKSATHSVWLLIAFITGVTFIGYFVPIRELLSGLLPYRDGATGMLRIDAHPVAAFWTFFFMAATYVNAGWMREQVCKYMCPYARFQSVMYDSDTLAVYYDAKRGEPRGTRKAHSDFRKQGLGECIDCSWCVQVCPVDIDIRDGMQYECINCGLCADACNAVMDRMQYPRGLVCFTSENQLKTGKIRFIRPRLFGYSAAVFIMFSVFSFTIANRSPLSVDVVRDRGARLYRLSGGTVQNVYTLKINNMDSEDHVYNIALQGDLPYQLKSYRPSLVEAGEVFAVPLRVFVNKAEVSSEKSEIVFVVTTQDQPELSASEQNVFIGPAR
ncbi:MAG: cytochrome c oxidase accessory protein CcoG [Cellvibrionaceae bacterium]|nr:cytochrome c oxidase accessory protein CcoG [Cellvibrionaceae bacterium]